MNEIKITWRKEGDWLYGSAWVQTPGGPVRIEGQANLAEIVRLLTRAHHGDSVAIGYLQSDPIAVGFLGGIIKAAKKAVKGVAKTAKGVAKAHLSIAKAAVKVAKSKVVKQIYNTARKVTKSPIFNAALAATAVAFPMVGVPALAAFTLANKTLDQVEAGNRAAQQTISTLKSLARKPGPAGDKARRSLKVLNAAHTQRKKMQAAAAKVQRVRPQLSSTPSPAQQWAALARLSPQQQDQLRRLAAARV